VSQTVGKFLERISGTDDVTFLYAPGRFAGRLPEAFPLEPIMIERSCFLGLVTSAVEAYNRETNGFLVGNRGTRLVRQKPRSLTVLRAAYPLQTEDRKPNWVSHGNEKAFRRARGAIENADVGYAVLGGFHSHTGDDGAASLSRTDLDYVADELRRISRGRPTERVKWLEVVMALRRREWAHSHEAGWATRRYRRKIGCTVALDANHGYDMTIGGYWVEGEPDGEPGTWDVVGQREARLLLPWMQ
jgi:proteasome lid subunit RPN8/RPN11